MAGGILLLSMVCCLLTVTWCLPNPFESKGYVGPKVQSQSPVKPTGYDTKQVANATAAVNGSLSVNSRQKRSMLGSIVERAVDSGDDTNMFINVGLRQDYLLQDCADRNNLKMSFPDVDYAFFGYDILRSYPLALGADPGFTYPIFRADYSSGMHTSDCRFSVPKGLVITPDVSCSVSFSSSVVENIREFEKQLSTSASVSAGGWGVQFSASAGYKEASSELSSGKTAYIISSAYCNYYTSRIQDIEHPVFDNSFLQWVRKLENGNDRDYLEFFERYGTHYPTKVKFGARFTHEHKMQSSTLKNMQSSGFNVGVAASYSGIVSVGGSFNLDSSQRQQASTFQENVTTTTITVGSAPPPDGSAMTWASSVQQNPVPTGVELDVISNLFTERYMSDLKVDYRGIAQKLKDKRQIYWESVQTKEGADDFEFDLQGSVIVPNWYVEGDYQEDGLTYSDCFKICKNLEGQCYGASFCKDCSWKRTSQCKIFGPNNKGDDWSFNEEWQTIINAREMFLEGMAVVDPAGKPKTDFSRYIGALSGARYNRAESDCRSEFAKAGDDASAYSFGPAFNNRFAFCKVYPKKRSIILEKKDHFRTGIRVTT